MLIAVIAMSILWLIGVIMGVNALSQFSLMSIPLFSLWVFYGPAFVKVIRFPLFFLILSVPFGEFLIPHLQEVTADLTVFFLQLVNVPIYREGLYLYIPEGTFHVAEACSGIRFLFSTITLGLLITHLQIQSRKRQLFFIVCSCLIPILANGLRAFLMVFIGHVSDMQAAVGFDHIVYGWVFFCFVIILVVLLGNKVSDLSSRPSVTSTDVNIPAPKNLLLVGFLSAIVVGPIVYGTYNNKLESYKVNRTENLTKGKVQLEYTQGWAPIYPTADMIFQVSNRLSTQLVVRYDFEDQNKELISWENRLYEPDFWTIKSTQYEQVTIDQVDIPYRVIVVVNSSGLERKILLTYKVGNKYFSNDLKVKFYQLISKLTYSDFGGQALISSVLVKDNVESSELIKKLIDYNSSVEY